MFLFMLGKILLFLMVTHANGMKLPSTNEQYVLSPKQAHYYPIQNENHTNITLKTLQLRGVICRDEKTNDVHIGILGDDATKETVRACLPNATIHLIDNSSKTEKPKQFLAFWTTTAIFDNKKYFPYFSLYTLPEATLPKNTSPEATLPKNTLPKNTSPEATLPKNTLPKNTLPKNTLPEATLPDDKQNNVYLRFDNLIENRNPNKDTLLKNQDQTGTNYTVKSNSIIKGDIVVHQYLKPEQFIVSSLLYINNNGPQSDICNELIFALYQEDNYKVLDTINNRTMLSLVKPYQQNIITILNNLHKNNLVSNQHSIKYNDTTDPDTSIIIDDAYIPKEFTENDSVRLNVLLRLILNSTKTNLKYTIYCLYTRSFSRKFITYGLYEKNGSNVKFLQIEYEKGFFSEPIYFNNVYHTNTILPLHLYNQDIKTPSNNNVRYTVVENINDYFKQSPDKKKLQTQYILNDRSIITKMKDKNNAFTPTLPDNITKALQDVQSSLNTIKTVEKNIDTNTITKSLEIILNATQKNLSYINKLCIDLDRLYNDATAQSKTREDKLKKEISDLETSSTKVLKEFKVEIQRINETIETAKKDTESIKQTLKDTVQNANNTFTTETKTLQQQLLASNLATMQQHIQNCQESMKALQNTFTIEYQNTIATLKEEFNKKLDEKYNEIKSLTDKTVANANATDTRLRNTIAELYKIQEKTKEANTTLETTILKINDAEKELADIITKSKEMQAEIELNLKNLQTIEALQITLKTANTTITNLQEDLKTANTTITNLQKDLNTANTTITNLQTDLNTANEKITSLQGFNWRLNFCTTVCAIYLLLKIKNLIAEGHVQAIFNDLVNVLPIST